MRDLKKGKLTIGVPSYNGASNLSQMIDSVSKLGLNKDQYEILVVDNSSADNTCQVVEHIQSSTSNVRFYKNESNIGRIENWNRVLSYTDSEYVILMNVNDRFLDFDCGKYLQLLNDSPDVSFVMTDVDTDGRKYPAWKETGVIPLTEYLRKTFLDHRYLEFNSMGVLQQHIFRTDDIVNFNVKFEPQIPRTTDRVFTAELAKMRRGLFYYVPMSMVGWYPRANRYHYSVHNAGGNLNFKELWEDEYSANLQVAEIAGLDLNDFLKSQLVFARFMMYLKVMQVAKKLFIRKLGNSMSPDIISSPRYYKYLKKIAIEKDIAVNFEMIRLKALLKAIRWCVSKLYSKGSNQRSLKGIMRTTSF